MHQSLECGAGIGDLGESGLRTREAREKFLVFINRLIAFAGSLVELAKIVVGKNTKQGKTLRQSPRVRQRALVA